MMYFTIATRMLIVRMSSSPDRNGKLRRRRLRVEKSINGNMTLYGERLRGQGTAPTADAPLQKINVDTFVVIVGNLFAPHPASDRSVLILIALAV